MMIAAGYWVYNDESQAQFRGPSAASFTVKSNGPQAIVSVQFNAQANLEIRKQPDCPAEVKPGSFHFTLLS
jgi:hypothetical protein